MTTTQPDEGRTPLSDEELAEALDCVEQALTAPWEPSFVFGTTGSEALQRVRAEVDRLRAEVAGYRSAICFETTCTSCARTLDSMAGAEAELDRLRAENTALAGKLAKVRENQLGMARGFAHDAEAQSERPEFISKRAEGAAWGAVAQLQLLLMELGEVEYDEAAETTWEIVTAPIALGGGDRDGGDR
jgi:hypothetical protein